MTVATLPRSDQGKLNMREYACDIAGMLHCCVHGVHTYILCQPHSRAGHRAMQPFKQTSRFLQLTS